MSLADDDYFGPLDSGEIVIPPHSMWRCSDDDPEDDDLVDTEVDGDDEDERCDHGILLTQVCYACEAEHDAEDDDDEEDLDDEDDDVDFDDEDDDDLEDDLDGEDDDLDEDLDDDDDDEEEEEEPEGGSDVIEA